MKTKPQLLLLLIITLFNFCSVDKTQDKTQDPEGNVIEYKKRYEGSRWLFAYGSYSGTEQFALNELNAAVQQYMPYTIECTHADNDVNKNNNLVIIGTIANNKLIAELVEKSLIDIPKEAQGYTIACLNSPWQSDYRIIVIAGSDANGVLYGVQYLKSSKLYFLENSDSTSIEYLRKAFDTISDFNISEYPLIENRGIWTWGYVIYDYKSFLDNMAHLKMNMLTIWLDCPPININDIISYAHSRGIKIIIGFPCGWGTSHGLDNGEGIQAIKEMALKEYTKYYRDLDIDGIYFQTKTEHKSTEYNGKSVAEIACIMVNEIAEGILKVSPGLDIQFGLHASSIIDNYTDLADLNSQVTITWEDAGAIPFSYNPVGIRAEGTIGPNGINTFQETLDYAKKLCTFRENSVFGMVPKGWITLDWKNDFEHHGLFVMGEHHSPFIEERLKMKQAHWDKKNIVWQQNFHMAKQFYSEIVDCNPKSITATGLIEDGMFEIYVQPCVALFAKILWNPKQPSEGLWEASQNLANAINND